MPYFVTLNHTYKCDFFHMILILLIKYYKKNAFSVLIVINFETLKLLELLALFKTTLFINLQVPFSKISKNLRNNASISFLSMYVY